MVKKRWGKKQLLNPKVLLNILEELETEKGKLKTSEGKYSTIVNNISEVIMVTEPNGAVSYLTPNCKKVFGYSAKEIIEKSLNIIFPEDNEYAQKKLKKALKGKSGKGFEYRIVTKDNKIRWINHSWNSILKNNKLHKIISLIIDITDKKEAEEELKISEEKYRTFIENSFGIVYKAHITGVPIIFDGAVEEITGYKKEDFLSGKIRWKNIILQEDLKVVNSSWEKLSKIPNTSLEREYRIKRKDGKIRWIQENIQNLLNGDKKPAYVQGSLDDITEKKIAGGKLKTSEENFRTIFEKSNDGILAADMKTKKFILANQKISQMLGYSEKEIKKLFVKDIHPKKDLPEVLKKFKDQASGNIPIADNVPMLRKNKTIFYADISSYPILFEGKEVLIGFFRDITKRMDSEEKLKTSEELFKGLADQSPNMIFINQNGKVIYANQKVEELTGYKIKEITSPKFDFMKIIAPESKELVETSFQRHMNGEEVPPQEYSIITKNGKRLHAIYTTKLINFKGSPAILGTITDITEKRRIEEVIINEKKFSDLITDSLPGIFYLFDKSGKFIKWNKNFERVTEYSRAEILNLKALDFFKGENKKIIREGIKEVFIKGKSSTEAILTTKTKKEIPYYLTGFLLNEGESQYVVGTGIDISTRKEAEEELRASEKRYHSLFNNMLNGFAYHKMVFDESGKPIDYIFLEINESFEKLTGLKKDKVIGKKVTKALPGIEKDPKNWIKKYGNVARTRKGIRFEQHSEELKKWYSVYAYSPKKGYFATIFEDITDRKEAEEELKKLASIVRHTSELVNLSDANGKMIFINNAGSEMLGINPEELKNHNIMEVIPEHLTPLVQNKLLPTLNKGKIWEGDLQYKNVKTNKLTDVHAITFSIKDPKTGKIKYFANTSTDITDRKKIEQKLDDYRTHLEILVKKRTDQLNQKIKELRGSYEKLKGLEVLKSKFLTITSHELKTPLTPAKIQTQMLVEGDLGKLSPEQKTSFDIILRNFNRLDDLIDDILEISRLEAEGFKLSCEQIQINDIIKDICYSLKDPAKSKNIELAFKLGEIPKISVDKKRIKQVLTNLVENAIKFTNKGKITIQSKREGNYVNIKVNDTGLGIPNENLKDIFNPFFQVEGTFTREHGGTGLGLSICRGIVEQHNGKIGVKSTIGKGSTFYFNLPINDASKS